MGGAGIYRNGNLEIRGFRWRGASLQVLFTRVGQKHQSQSHSYKDQREEGKFRSQKSKERSLMPSRGEGC